MFGIRRFIKGFLVEIIQMKTLEIISKASDDIHEARMSALPSVGCDGGLILV